MRPLHRPLHVASRLLALLCVMLSLLPVAALAAVLRLDAPPAGSLGKHLQLFQEPGAPLTIEAARQLAGKGEFRQGRSDVPSFGIGAAPVWVKLTLDNPTSAPLQRQLFAGTTWIDHLDLYLVRNGKVVLHQDAGDASPGQLRPIPGIGFVFPLELGPGHTELFLRAATPDPLLLPLRLLTTEQATARQQVQHYSYGLIYGFLLALVAYNAMLWMGLRQPAHLNYSVYLGLFILMNVAYTGHGYAWFWPDRQGLQHYVILVLMILFSCSGLRFAGAFLNLPTYTPRLAQQLRSVCLAVCALMAIIIAADRQREAALLAFSFTLLFALGMVTLGIFAVHRQLPASRYFLAAACSGMAGALVTALTVWGVLPYTTLTYHAAEVGVLTEATLLALAVAHLVHQHESARRHAEQLARIDSLTGLLNRRAFLEQAEGVWNSARRHQHPLSVIILDIDHFKTINDAHGHASGDAALRATAALIETTCRHDDLAARWGGEEFILLLPETPLQQAQDLAEKLRAQFASHPLGNGPDPVWIRASFGVATRDAHYTLEDLIHEADTWLYRAKQNGRDQVCSLATVFTAPG